MGDRRNVEIRYSTDPPLYLYTHWCGSELPSMVAEALHSKPGRNRWDDPSYLARIIFDTMTEGSSGRETGFGISTSVVDQNHPNVVVDVSAQTADGLPFEEFITRHRATAPF